MINSKRKVPIGIFSGIFLALGLALHFWPKPACNVLENTLENGFFMRWQAPILLVIRSDKAQDTFNAETKELACKKALIKITENNG